MAQLLLANPRRRRKSRSRSVARRSRRRYRRNPIRSAGIMGTVKKGAIGAAGALAVDFAMQKLPIPAQFQSGALAPAVKGAVGIGLGMLVAKFGKNRALGQQLADGAVVVALYGVGKNMVGPSLGLSGDLLGYDWMDDEDSLNYISPAQTIDMDEMDSDMGFVDVNDVGAGY